jgi:hypothetical protein
MLQHHAMNLDQLHANTFRQTTTVSDTMCENEYLGEEMLLALESGHESSHEVNQSHEALESVTNQVFKSSFKRFPLLLSIFELLLQVDFAVLFAFQHLICFVHQTTSQKQMHTVKLTCVREYGDTCASMHNHTLVVHWFSGRNHHPPTHAALNGFFDNMLS